MSKNKANRKSETRICKRMTGWTAQDYRAFYRRAGYVYIRVDMNHSIDAVTVTGRR